MILEIYLLKKIVIVIYTTWIIEEKNLIHNYLKNNIILISALMTVLKDRTIEFFFRGFLYCLILSSRIRGYFDDSSVSARRKRCSLQLFVKASTTTNFWPRLKQVDGLASNKPIFATILTV